jgi:type II secretory pathway pseudopilin PulG
MKMLFKKFISGIKKQSGYTLAELSISTSIIAMLAVGGLSIMGKKNESDKVTLTNTKLATIETALKSYIRTNRYVPCPALPNLLESNTAFGNSVAYNTTTHLCDGGGLVNGTGALPVRTLNLSDDYTYDGWGRKFTYRSSDASGVRNDFDVNEFHGNIAIVDMKGVNKTDINELPPFNNGAVYVVISHGSNGRDVAYGKNTTSTPASLATGPERKNTDHSVSTYVQAPKSTTFDDIVIYGMKKKIMPPRNIAAPTQLDALACENARSVLSASRDDLNNFANSNGSTSAARADALFKSARKIANLCDNAPTIDLRPASLTDLAFWADADDALTLYGTAANTGASADCVTGPAPANGYFIGCWKDKSGNGHPAIQSTAAKKPTYVTNSLNSRPAINFDGTDDFLTAGANVPQAVSNGLTVFGVASVVDTNAATGQIASYVAAADGAGWQFSFAATTMNANITLKRTATWGTDTAAAASPPVSNQFNIYTGRVTATTDTQLYVNGGSPVTTTTAGGNIQYGASPEFNIGAKMAGTLRFLKGKIAEVIVYNRALTTNERQGIESYLSNKWAIPVSGATQQCPPGLTFQKTAAVPQGSCQCAIAGQVLFQELNNSSACFAGQNVTFNKCVANPDSYVTYNSAPFSAPPPSAGMALWLDANDCSTIKLSPGNKVNLWLDKSPAINSVLSTNASVSTAGNNLMQGVDANRPLYVTGAANNKSVVRFSGSSFMTSSSVITNAPGDDVSVLVVGAIKATNPITGPNPTYASYGSSVGSVGWSLYYNSASSYNPTFIVKRDDSWGSNISINNTKPPSTTASMNYVVMTGLTTDTKTTIFLNGQEITNIAANGGSINYGSNARFEIGSSAGGNNKLNGDIAEVIVYNRALATTERKAIEQYLAYKWQLFLDPVSPKDPATNTILGNGITSSTLRSWLDASDTSTVYPTSGCPGSGANSNEGDVVGCWVDKSPNGYSAQKVAGTGQPSYKLSRLNGKPAIVFNGTTNCLNHLTIPFGTGAYNNAMVFMVLQGGTSTVPGTPQIPYAISNTISNTYSFVVAASMGTYDYGVNAQRGINVSSLTPTPDLYAAPHIYELQFTASSTANTAFRFWVDGLEPTYAYNRSAASLAFTDGGTIGALQNGASSYAQMDLGEIIIYGNTAATYMSDIDRKKIEAYLSSKWNIAVTP